MMGRESGPPSLTLSRSIEASQRRHGCRGARRPNDALRARRFLPVLAAAVASVRRYAAAIFALGYAIY